jgi:hypothetical protein
VEDRQRALASPRRGHEPTIDEILARPGGLTADSVAERAAATSFSLRQAHDNVVAAVEISSKISERFRLILSPKMLDVWTYTTALFELNLSSKSPRIGGLTIATFLTLLLVPVLYTIVVRDLKWIRWEREEVEG